MKDNDFSVNSKLKYGIIGLGLIGASIAKSLRRVYKDCTIVAYNRSEEARQLAISEKVADMVTAEVDSSFGECDYIFLCTPVEHNCTYLKKLKSVIKKDAVITDVGSVKGNIHEEVKKIGLEENFMGGHPMAGSEKTGYKSATDRLFENAFYVITPTGETDVQKIKQYGHIVEDMGAIPIILDPNEHDFAVAAISHLPHIIAAELVNLVKHSDSEKETMKRIAAGGFKDITRIASSSPQMWEEICTSNSVHIVKLLDKYIESLKEVRERLANRDGAYINHIFTESREYREKFSDKQNGIINVAYTLYVDIIDEAGSLLPIATLMAKNNISMKNIGIVNNRENEGGVLSVTYKNIQDMECAARILSLNGYQVHLRK